MYILCRFRITAEYPVSLDINLSLSPLFSGKGRGRQVIAVARTADLILMMLDSGKSLFVIHCNNINTSTIGIDWKEVSHFSACGVQY